MSDPASSESQNLLSPPPAPPLPPGRLGQLQRIIAPWGKHSGSKSHGLPVQGDHDDGLRRITGIHTYRHDSHSSRTATHRTGIPIAALDINRRKTHAVLAGKEILKTVRVHDGKVTEDLNIRASISSYAAAHSSSQLDRADKRREYLPARDVKWSIGHWEHIIATAATNGRIALYDLNAPSPKTELAWLHEHTGQINKLDFDPHAGYLLLSASQDKSVRLWDLRQPQRDKSRIRFEVRSAVRDVRWSPFDPFDFAICADGGVVQKWDARVPISPKLSINAHEKACYSIDYHPDGRHLVSGGFDKYIRVWDFQSEKKRQKPVFQLKAPHAIRNIRWKPACNAPETGESTFWQSTQVAVSYYHDDPRLHIWDLRRPHLPFRELDRYNMPPNDLLWADEDLLWTAGDEGIFTQWDIKHTSPFHNQIASCTSTFLPDGEYYTFSEAREVPRVSFLENAADGFLNVPPDKLSSGDDGPTSRSLTDDEGGLESTVGTSIRRREGVNVPSRSTKFHGDSPSSAEDKPSVLPLDAAIFNRPDLFNNNQVGASGYIPGVAAEPQVVEYLASHYAVPATADDNKLSPDTILSRLQNAFDQNAAACDAVSMHRMAQSWRILGAVIVPEIKDWADGNRASRRADAARRRETLENFRAGGHRPGLSPLAGLPARGFNPKLDSKGQKLISSLFKGVSAGDRPHQVSETDSTSNMTTPLAKPLPNSPPPSLKRRPIPITEEGLDNIAPLPPSVLSSHSTAAAAARALMGSPNHTMGVDAASPELLRSAEASKKFPTQTGSPVSPVKRPRSEFLIEQKTTQSWSQEDRRAALRDYRIQARPIFSLAESAKDVASQSRHDSDESFPMFSVSTDSSHRSRSIEQSFGSPRSGARTSTTLSAKEAVSSMDDDYDLSCSDDHDGRRLSPKQGRPTTPDDNDIGVSAVETPLDMSFGNDAQVEPSTSPLKDEGIWHPIPQHESMPPSHVDTAASSSPDIFLFEEGVSMTKPRIHTSNPIRGEAKIQTTGNDNQHQGNGSFSRLSMEELDHETYLYQDFRPIDLSKYEPKLPFAWSSLPLICQCIFFDMENGIGQAQFAAHLLMHVHPYFFHANFRRLRRAQDEIGDNLADRLMTPHLGHRIIEAIFEGHISFLRQMGLFESAALLRKMCVEFDYPGVYRSPSGSKQAGGSLGNGDSMTLSIVCSNCQGPLTGEKGSCERCRQVRSVCPICQSLRDMVEKHTGLDLGAQSQYWGHNANMWMFCQACGHSGHVHCLMEWFSQPFSEGRCPTSGCGCDCGPGLTREQRMQQQVRREDEAKLIRGPKAGTGTGGSTKRDLLRATPSPAVDKARVALRNSLAGERATQSGDERTLPGRRGSSRGRTSAYINSKKSVRLITPGEESEQSQPHTPNR
ncbi:double-strand break repair protein MRE11 [Fonsecaea pedrosoi]|nr:double-strand break repair protein MRE11 [Fonsecaea pedrosoi]